MSFFFNQPDPKRRRFPIPNGVWKWEWSDTLKPHTQGDIIKHRKGAADGTKIHGRI